jgi:hypothetical protein
LKQNALRLLIKNSEVVTWCWNGLYIPGQL